MHIISTNEFEAICNDPSTRVLKYGKSLDQPKVFEKKSDTIIKLFYAKKTLWSSDHIYPRARRFAANVKKLHAHGFSVPIISETQFCPDLKIHLLYYAKLAGQDVRYLAKNGHADTITAVAKLLADLHGKGIFFRSIHLENLLYDQNSSTFSLLDVTDVRFKNYSLSVYLRYRNIRHLLQEPHDQQIWKAYGVQDFMQEYFKESDLSAYSRKMLDWLVQRFTAALTPSQTSFANQD